MDKIDNDISFCNDCVVSIKDRLPAIEKLFGAIDEPRRNKAAEARYILSIVQNLDEDVSALRQRLEEIVRENPPKNDFKEF